MSNGLLLFVLSLICIPGWGETPSHRERQSSSERERPLIELTGFKSIYQQEIIPHRSQPELSIQLEDGTLQLGDLSEKKARRIYQGTKNRPTGALDLLATDAGKAKTWIAAKRACEKLIPLGEWRLATVPHIMAFFGDLLPGYPIPQNPEKNGYLFWAANGNEEEDKKNRDTFFTTPELGGKEIESYSYSEFVNQVRRMIAQTKVKEEKAYWIGFLKHIKDGIPVICVSGQEP